MKECPKCRAIYNDPSLAYCLADGSLLAEFREDDPTVVRTVGNVLPPTVVMPGNVSAETVDSSQRPGAGAPSSGTSLVLKILLAFVGLAILVVIAGVAGALFFFNSGNTQSLANTTPTAGSSPLPASTTRSQSDQAEELRDQIANLEKRLNTEQKKNTAVNIPLTMPERSAALVTARVNSPTDGFLALRTLPNSELGERIYKIPHGASVSVGPCGPVVTPVKRSGRWCQASYNGYSGWVFDGYLVY